MGVDVLTEIEIDRSRDWVATYATDPSNAPAWYVNIKAVEWKTPPPVGVGSRLAEPLMAAAMRRANRKDLARLKVILEGRPTGG